MSLRKWWEYSAWRQVFACPPSMIVGLRLLSSFSRSSNQFFCHPLSGKVSLLFHFSLSPFPQEHLPINNVLSVNILATFSLFFTVLNIYLFSLILPITSSLITLPGYFSFTSSSLSMSVMPLSLFEICFLKSKSLLHITNTPYQIYCYIPNKLLNCLSIPNC